VAGCHGLKAVEEVTVGALSILLVEPNEEVRNLQRSWLENDGGWCIDEADSGSRALERISADFGILVMARFLPDMTDAEFLRRVDETAFQGRILHCRTVGTFDEEEYPGVDSSISKPLFESEFVQVVRDIVDTVSPE
jgi:CheY-like chemotaxis protein